MGLSTEVSLEDRLILSLNGKYEAELKTFRIDIMYEVNT